MVSDFFYPSVGGVEEHIYNLSQILLARGHKVSQLIRILFIKVINIIFFFFFQVVVLTHCYRDCKGVRYLTNGLKVYYLPIKTFYNEATLPTVLCQVPLVRCVLLREQIEIGKAFVRFI